MKRPAIFDSSVWIEIFRRGPLLRQCTKALETHKIIGIPSVCIFEIYRKILTAVSEESALSAVAYLRNFSTMELSMDVALTAGDLSIIHKLAMADSIVLAHAITHNALLVTLDNDFVGIDGTKVIR